MSDVEDIRRFLAEEGAASETGRDIDVPLVRNRTPTKDPAQVYSLRIPVPRLEELRQLAERSQIAPSALMRRWVLERLDHELEISSQVAEKRESLAGSDDDEDLLVISKQQYAEDMAQMVSEVVKEVARILRDKREDSA